MQIGPHLALHVAACPGQLMKLVVSVLSSPKHWKLSLTVCEKSHPYYWIESGVILSTPWLMCLGVTPTPTSGIQSLLTSSYVSGLNGLAFILLRRSLLILNSRLVDYCPYFQHNNFYFPTLGSWILYSALCSLPSALVIQLLDQSYDYNVFSAFNEHHFFHLFPMPCPFSSHN